MKIGFENSLQAVLITVIRQQATIRAIDALKQNSNYNQPLILLIIGFIMLFITSIYFNIWWLFIPVIFIYFLYDYIRKFRFIKQQLPTLMDEIIISTLKLTVEDLVNITEDLDIKTKNNIYNSLDIEEIKSEISMLKLTEETLKNLHKEVKLKL